jgi:hypothetical protein
MLPSAVGVVGTAASVLGLGIAVVTFVRRRSRPGKYRIHTIRFWHRANYNLALQELERMVGHWSRREFDTESRRGFVTEYDLVKWIIQLALACAAAIVPQSLGKASLFRIGEITADEQERISRVRVFSFELTGVFSPEQMHDFADPRRMRDMSIVLDGQDEDHFPAALQCIRNNYPMLQSLRQRDSRFDRPERALGLTHILAIPLRSDLRDAQPDEPVSITVDLHFSRPVAYLVDRCNLHRRILFERSQELMRILSSVNALHEIKFSPNLKPTRDDNV